MVLKTQLIPPKLKKNLLRRDRLIEILYQNLDKKLIVITAGAGYGKTTLISQFVNELSIPVVYYGIRREDKRLITFISYLIAGLQEIYEGFGTRIRSIIEIMKANINLEILMRTFVNELIDATKGEDLFIILDDYHRIDEIAPINKAVEYLIEYSPYNIHTVISSRSMIPLSVTKFIVKAEVLELSNEDLRFTGDETQKLFKEVYKLDVPITQLEVIEHCFAGWVTALQLMSYLFEKDPKNALNRVEYGKENVEYFADEVFNQQSKEVQSFLIKSCIMEQMTPEACNTILGIENSREILDELMNKNLFISCVDEEKEVFVYHQLFRNFLLNRLSTEMDKKSIKELHLGAGEYFNEIRDYNNGIQHYLSGEEVQRAAEIIEVEGGNLLPAGMADTLEQWIKKLPNNIVENRATLLLYQGEIHRWRGKYENAIPLYQRAQKKFMKEDKQDEAIKALLRVAFALSGKGDSKRAIRLAKKVLNMIGEQESVRKIDALIVLLDGYTSVHKVNLILSEALRICKEKGYHKDEIILKETLLYTQLEQDKFEEVIEEGERLINEIKDSFSRVLSGVYLNVGLAYALTGSITQGKKSLKKAFEVSNALNDTLERHKVFDTISSFNIVIGNYALARSYGNRVLRFCNNIGLKRGLRDHALYNVTLGYLFDGKLVKAKKYFNKITSPSQLDLIAKGEIALESGNLNEAKKSLTLALNDIRRRRSPCKLMLVHVAFSKLYYKKLDEKLLIKHLKRTLGLSKTYNYHFPLIRLGRIDFPLLQFAINRGIEPHYAEYLLEEFYVQYDLVVKFFGGLEIWSGGKRLVDKEWKTRRAKLLFCYLVMNRRKGVSRDKLIETLWPGAMASKARDNLHYNLSCIRDTFSYFVQKNVPIVEYKIETYQLSPNYKIWTDVDEFERLMREAEKGSEPVSMSKYESAISLYGGDFLTEMYDDWSEEQRLFYKEQYLKALNKVANFYMNESRFDKAIGYCKKVISISEFNEAAYYIAIKSYLLNGERKLALDLYNQLEKVLKSELNLAPSSKIKSLFTLHR